jgi:hypothetical protein
MDSTNSGPRPSGPADACAQPSAQAYTSEIIETLPCRWRATLNDVPLDGDFGSVEDAFAAIVRAMRERYGLIRAASAPDSAVAGCKGGEA